MSVISAIRERPKVQAPDIRADEAKIKPPGRRAFFRKLPGSENRQEMATFLGTYGVSVISQFSEADQLPGVLGRTGGPHLVGIYPRLDHFTRHHDADDQLAGSPGGPRQSGKNTEG